MKCKQCKKIIKNPNKKVFCSYACGMAFHGDSRMNRTWAKR